MATNAAKRIEPWPAPREDALLCGVGLDDGTTDAADAACDPAAVVDDAVPVWVDEGGAVEALVDEAPDVGVEEPSATAEAPMPCVTTTLASGCCG